MGWRRSGAVVWSVLMSLLACAGPAEPEREGVPAGSWGGDHAALTVDLTGADYELDCAHGRMESPLRLDASGRFAVEGYLVREGGPTREGPEERLPAVFSGSSDGRRVTFSLTLPDSGDSAGPFTVFLGEPARLLKCL